MATDEEIIYDRRLLGVENPTGRFYVTADMIIAFARSIGETNPAYLDEEAARASPHGGLVAPPSFCNALVSGRSKPDIQLEFGEAGLFAGQAIESFLPVRPGDTLEARTRLSDVYAKTGRSGKMVFVVWETDFANQHGQTVTTVRESYVRRNIPSNKAGPTGGE